ncbi:MAG: hypothetical protein V7L05_10645 [Nostoc sp.]|uniref:hypothetical protein n=1 Tax=Nostoc sp. TaxID=1180 RepID=UPI002FF9512B
MEAYLDVPELEQIIVEINLAYYEQEQLIPIIESKKVSNLLINHLFVTFETDKESQNSLETTDVNTAIEVNNFLLKINQEI